MMPAKGVGKTGGTPKNANVRIEGAAQKDVERRILQALRNTERTKTELYKNVGGHRINSSELGRILEELAERQIVSHRVRQSGPYPKVWALYNHPAHIEIRRLIAEEKARMAEYRKRWELDRHRKLVATKWNEFVQDECKRIMDVYPTVLRLISRTANHRTWIHSRPLH